MLYAMKQGVIKLLQEGKDMGADKEKNIQNVDTVNSEQNRVASREEVKEIAESIDRDYAETFRKLAE